MRILFVANSSSIHTARWIEQLAGEGWDLHLFCSLANVIKHPVLRNIKIHSGLNAIIPFNILPGFSKLVAIAYTILMRRYFPKYKQWHLDRTILRVKPDVIHSIEIQHAGYLTMAIKKQFKGDFPRWIVTNWGSDIYLYRHLPEHAVKIREVLKNCDYYSCECQRDVCLAQGLGLKGNVLPIFPNTGGFDLQEVQQLRIAGPTSLRRVIVLKGYQHFAGRALVGIRAIERCADILCGYELVIYSAAPDVALAARILEQTAGIKTTIIPENTEHKEILALHGKARISIGLSISDAISTSFLESLVMGSFPIQSWTSCADEWVQHGITGLLVPPEDPEVIEQAIRQALADDVLVDKAAQLNWATACERLDKLHIAPKAVNIYRSVYQET